MQIGKELLYLSAADIARVEFSIEECIDVMEHVYRLKSELKIEAPTKPRIGDPQTEGFLKAYPARILDNGPVGTKWLGAKSTNPALFSLPTINGLIVLNDPNTFCPVAIMDCTRITGLRTAGVSGVALRHFTQDKTNTISVLGCGVQGRTHLSTALKECKKVDKIYAWDPNSEYLERFAKEMGEKHGIRIETSNNAQLVVSAADVLLSSTPFGNPDKFTMIEKEWLKEGVTAISISGANHFTYEAFMSFDRYFMDDLEIYLTIQERPQPWKNTNILAPIMLGDYLQGKAHGRKVPHEKMILVTGGEGVCDISVAKIIADRALENHIGTILPL